VVLEYSCRGTKGIRARLQAIIVIEPVVLRFFVLGEEIFLLQLQERLDQASKEGFLLQRLASTLMHLPRDHYRDDDDRL